MNYDDETLMAYADGELDAAQRAAIAAAIEKDPALASRIEKHRALRAKVAGAYAGIADQEVPRRLVDAASAPGSAPASGRGKVLQFPAKGARAIGPAWSGREWFAMAASVLLGVVISWKVFAPREPGLMVIEHGSLVARGELATALDKQLASDQRPDEPVQIGVTFKSRDGGYCRSFTLPASESAGLACRANGEWRVAATATAEPAAGAVRQATGAIPAAILAAIDAHRAGDALDAAGEENARLGGWKE